MKSWVNARGTFRRARLVLLGCALAALTLPASSQAASADLAVSQTDAPDPVKAGETLTYSIQVSNAGPDPAEDVRLVDTLSHRVTFAAADLPTCTPSSTRRIVCELGTLASGATVTVTVEVTPSPAGQPYTAVNIVSLGKRKSDPRLSNNTRRVATRVETPPPVLCAGRVANVVGTDGNDDLVGTSGRDVIALLGGSDQVATLGGDDIVCGSSGDDAIRGGSGNDLLRGGGGTDALKGGDGDDEVSGKGGNDALDGGGGNDVLKGGGGADSCRGGGGTNIKRSC